jgi:predicted Zn-dependent protease
MHELRLTTPALDAQIRIEWGGLMLMAGDSTPAAELTTSVGRGGVAPEYLVRLAWWYYRAGKYPDAEALLLSLANQRPGDANLQHHLAWVELEQNKVDKAIVRFKIPGDASAPPSSAQWNTTEMGMAVAQWKAHNADDALKNYEIAIQAEPRWLDQRLVRTFYSPLVTQNVAEMQAEYKKRAEAKQRHP